MDKTKLYMDVKYLKGVGPKVSVYLNKIGIKKVIDLIYYFPFRYEDRAHITKIKNLIPGKNSVIFGEVVDIEETVTAFKKKKIFKIFIKDDTGMVKLVAFNRPWIKKFLKEKEKVIVYGKIEFSLDGLQITNFDMEKIKEEDIFEKSPHMGRIVPIYRTTKDIHLKFLRQLVYKVLGGYLDLIDETLPERFFKKYSLISLKDALLNIHFPEDFKKMEIAKHRIKFEEFLYLSSALFIVKSKMRREKKKHRYILKKNILTPWKKSLPFEFTDDQKRAINEIFTDMLSPYPMNRLLQGEVGSGKTVVALSAMLLAVENGLQSAIVSPTEILAEQHFLNIKNMLKEFNLKVELLTGSLKKKDKERIYKNLIDGDVSIVVGTHALFEERVKFKKLSLVVIDEQQRFGVLQRNKLHKKGENVDVLILSATPIPRTLAMSWWGDLDVSEIKELPGNRKKVETYFLKEEEAYEFLKREVEKGNQGFIVYPLIDESDKMELKAATKQAEYLKKNVFFDYRVALLHGKLNPREKERIMIDFSKGIYDILVSTTVIEVGIDIPKATVIIIEDAPRFGLSTLHQLRGRVGRGNEKSYCILTGEIKNEKARRRIETLLFCSSGFEISEEDLKIRGAGEYLGVKQHGITKFNLADTVNDSDILKLARSFVFNELKENIFRDEFCYLRKKVYEIYRNKFHLGKIA